MKKIIYYLSIIALLSCIAPSFAAATAENLAPTGWWKTIDDTTGQPKAVVEIKEEAKQLTGAIVQVFPRADGVPVAQFCKACKGTKHNQPILGMKIMENLKLNKDNPRLWEQGSILDPKTGHLYHCTAQLTDNGNKLIVRGYVGLPLFGRSQTWERLNIPSSRTTLTG